MRLSPSLRATYMPRLGVLYATFKVGMQGTYSSILCELFTYVYRHAWAVEQASLAPREGWFLPSQWVDEEFCSRFLNFLGCPSSLETPPPPVFFFSPLHLFYYTSLTLLASQHVFRVSNTICRCT